MSDTAYNPQNGTPRQPFLARVAEAYWQHCGAAVSDYTFVFPYKRAGLFFRKYLSETAQRPLFAPKICTINQLFDELSAYRLADPIEQLFRLYRIYGELYCRPSGREESFDDFIFWGKMMLGDFNEVDQHLADARKLFTHLKEFKDIDLQFDHLGEEERLSVQTFMKDMQSDKPNAYRDKFLSLWHCLHPIYEQFRQELAADQLAYAGMMQRTVVEDWRKEDIKDTRYIFIGFNALTQTELQLMTLLQKADKADFYWDYESEWLKDRHNQASYYYEQNTHQFPSRYALPDAEPLQTPAIHLYKVPAATGQAGQIYRILEQLPAADDYLKVGIVLPDEQMLLPLKTAIPPHIQTVNVTMGQQLRLTPIYSIFEHLSELLLLQISSEDEPLFYYKPVLALLHHPYVYPIVQDHADRYEAIMLQGNKTYVAASFFAECELLQMLLYTAKDNQDLLNHLRALLLRLIVPAQEDSDEHAEQNEYIHRALTVINRLTLLLPRYPDIAMQQKTLYRLLLTLIGQESVPFEGEPLQGLQIMGVLESRSMDFSTVIMTNCNDDIFPGSPQMNSFIPYDLRCLYHLPTPQLEDAIFAYNFYRLISHAQEVYLLQNTLSDDNNSGEVSRYVYQLQHQYGIAIQETVVSYAPNTTETLPPTAKKTEEVLHQLDNMICPPVGKERGKGLSPSALNTYVSCPLHFYLTYVQRLREADRIEPEIGGDKTGNIIHKVMETLYAPYAGKAGDTALRNRTTITEGTIDSMIAKVKASTLVTDTYCQEFLHTADSTGQPLSGWDRIVIQTLTEYILKILFHDKTLTPFTYIGSELPISTRIPLPDGREVYMRGVADRIDEVGGQLRIVDYKTGTEHSKFPDPELLFLPKATDSDHVRQTLCYSMMLLNTTHADDCYPYIYYVKQPKSKLQREIAYTPKDQPALNGYRQMENPFVQALQQVLQELLDPAKPFSANPSDNSCRYCPFTQICGVKTTAFER